MATIDDVARLAGVSKTTVSHVLNETRPALPETERRVREAVAKLAYTPNTIARSLARSTTNSIGVAAAGVSNVYFGEIVRAIEMECSRSGLTMLHADTHDDPEHELRIVRALHERRVDGIILAPAGGPETLAYLTERRVPTVVLDRTVGVGFDQVVVENVESTRGLLEHLAGHGHQRIAFIHGQSGLSTTDERVQGFRSAVRGLGLDADPALLIDGQSQVAGAAAAVGRLLALAEPPTAIVSGNNKMTIGAMQGLRTAGRSVPDDVALAGFDDFEWADWFEPRLTVVAQPQMQLGWEAMHLLRERIADPKRQAVTVRLDPTLMVRSSCGCR